LMEGFAHQRRGVLTIVDIDFSFITISPFYNWNIVCSWLRNAWVET
jgi:hypothetical protein